MTSAPSASLGPVRQAWKGSSFAAKVTALIVAVAAVASVAPIYRAVESLLLPAPGAFAISTEDARAAETHAAAFPDYVSLLNARSPFWTPSKPGTDATVVVEEEPAEADTPAPARYEGPAIAAIVLDTIWFADGTRLSTTDDEKDGIKVVSTNAPWDALIRYRGKEFTVPFFERDKVILKESPDSSTRSSRAPARDAAPDAEQAPASPSKE